MNKHLKDIEKMAWEDHNKEALDDLEHIRYWMKQLHGDLAQGRLKKLKGIFEKDD